MRRQVLAIAVLSCAAAILAYPANAATTASLADSVTTSTPHSVSPDVTEGLADFKGVSPDKALTLQYDSDDTGTPIQNENYTGVQSQNWHYIPTNDCGDGAVNATCPFDIPEIDSQFFGDPIVEITSGQYSNRCVRDRGDGFMESNKCSGVSGVDFVKQGYSFINIYRTNNPPNLSSNIAYMTGGNANSTVADKNGFTEGYSQYGVKS
jgi:hypothetical protein